MSKTKPFAPRDGEEIVARLRSRDYVPCTTRQLMSWLGVGRERGPELRRTLRVLAEAGHLTQRRGRWYLAEAEEGVVDGRFTRHRLGFGFIRPDGGDDGDLYLSPRDASGLLHGDRVRARVLRVDHRGRRAGKVIRVLEAASRHVTGVIEIRGGEVQVIPYDERVARHVVIEAGRAHGAADRMAVGIELAGPPDEDGVARGSVVEVLGYPDEPGMDIEIIIRKYELRHEWPEEVAEEAEAIPDAVDPGEIARRTDFTSLPTVTIDGETARDFDDAISVERLPRGRWRLHVHIADVAHYVPPGGALDREAFARGTSVYFPGRAVPMLPEKLSNDLCSLKPDVARLVQSVVLELDAAGETREARFADGVIHSMERMTYTQVARILVKRDAKMLERYAPQVEMFRDMERLCELLQARRRKRGSIDFDLPEPEIVLNARGEMTGVFPTKRNIAHQIIEEFMLAANEAVAVHLVETGAPALFRGHEEPEERRLEAFDEVLQGLGYRLPRPFDAIEPRHLQDLLGLVAGKPEERFVSQLMLRAMRQARYDPQNLGHFGLAASHYTHFTSPIRRYPDLVVHRALRALRRGEFRGDDAAENRLRSALPEIAEQSSRTERVAEDAERELMAWKKMGFMGEKLGEEFHASVTGVMPFGMFLELEEYFVEGLVHISTLTDDEYRFEERGHLLRGRESARVFRLGDRVRARVVKVDHFLKRMDLELVEEGGRKSRPAGGRRKQRGKAPREPQPKPRTKSKRRKRRG